MRRSAAGPAAGQAALAAALAACLVPLVAASAGPEDAFILGPLPFNAGTPQRPLGPHLDVSDASIHSERLAAAYAARLNALLAAPHCSKLHGWSLQQLVAAVGRRRACSWADARALGVWTVLPQSCYMLPPECEAGVRTSAPPLWSHALFLLHSLAPAGTQTFERDASLQLRTAIARSFGSFSTFQANFAAAASGLMGSSWAWVVALPLQGRLQVLTTSDLDVPLMAGPKEGPSPRRLPVLALHLWEHADMQESSMEGGLQGARAAYIDAFFLRINWRGVNELYRLAGAGQYGTFDVLVPSSSWATQQPASLQA